ncbi:hypothetical protein D3C87_1488160 [compost metagenome]
MLIFIEYSCLTFSQIYSNRNQLIGKLTGLMCFLVFLLAFKGKLILLFTADVPLFGNILCGFAHGIRMIQCR